MSRPSFDVLDAPSDPDGQREIVVFLDTEFSSYTSLELISLGLVAANTGDELYIEVAGARDMVVSEFVREEVLPLLGMHDPEVLPYDRIAARLEGWFDLLRAGDRMTRIVLLFDSTFDWTLVAELRIPEPSQPPWLSSWNVVGRMIQHHVEHGRHWYAFQDEILKYHLRAGIRHHALIDARAMKYAFSASQSSE